MRKVLLLVLTVAALHALSAVAFPLFSVEAYYWLWGQYPACGYFDHPPMVGWISRIFFGWVLGNPLAARSGPIVLSALSALALYALARAMASRDSAQPSRVPWRMALLAALTPVLFLNGVLIQPDNSLLLFMSLTWLCFWKAVDQPEKISQPRLAWWLAAGIAAGGALLSKFHAWVLLPPLWAFLFISQPHRRLLRTPGPWLALVLMVVTVSPNLIWNAHHDWMNYKFQFHRSTVSQAHFKWRNPAIAFVGPLLTLSPLLYLAVVVAVWRGAVLWWRAPQSERDPRYLFLLLAGLPLPLLLALLSFGVTISLHWPAPGYPPLMLLALLLLERGELARWATPRFQRALFGCCFALVGFVVVVPHLLRALPASFALPFRSQMVNTAAIHEQISGWPEVGKHLRKMHDEYNQHSPTYIFARTWHLAASIAFYSKLPREVFAFKGSDAHNFELWRAERGGLAGATGIVVYKRKPRDHKTMLKKYDQYLREVGLMFGSPKPLASLLCSRAGTFELFLGNRLPGGAKQYVSEYLILKGKPFKGAVLPDTKHADEDKF